MFRPFQGYPYHTSISKKRVPRPTQRLKHRPGQLSRIDCHDLSCRIFGRDSARCHLLLRGEGLLPAK